MIRLAPLITADVDTTTLPGGKASDAAQDFLALLSEALAGETTTDKAAPQLLVATDKPTTKGEPLIDRERFLNARDTLRALLDNNIVPVINENDAVATAEIKVGDNDNLSALAAILAGADKLLLLTDQKGLYTADPRSNPQAELIKDVYGIDDALRAIAGDSVSGLGTGGMSTKLQAADVACRAGIDTIIAAGSKPGVIGDVMEGISVGTLFHAQATPLENRKRWIFGAPPAGEITVDEGATAAILERGSSLLPKGIKSVTGNFSRGEVIRICNLEGRDIAHGVSRYNSDALRRIAGHHSQEIDAILGYEYGPVAVHRDDMITR